MLTLSDLLSSSGKYPERANSPELTQELKDNGTRLVGVINSLLTELGITGVKVSSGFRPSSVNANVPGAAKKSLHMQCLAIDLEDKDGKIGKIVASKPQLLRKYGLFIENIEKTKGWMHCDLGSRLDRPSRMFNP